MSIIKTIKKSGGDDLTPLERLADLLMTALVGLSAALFIAAGVRTGPEPPPACSASAPDSYEWLASDAARAEGTDALMRHAQSLSQLPDEATVILVDVGHGGADGGAVGTRSGVAESGLNMQVSELLARELVARGFNALLTRNGEYALADTKDADMQKRRELMQMSCIDLCVSVHMNFFTDESVSGPMVFYMRGSTEGEKLATSVVESLCTALGRPKRLANPEDLFVLRVPSAPSVLVECGFLSNAQDEALLQTEEHQLLLARAIADGIELYLSGGAPPA